MSSSSDVESVVDEGVGIDAPINLPEMPIPSKSTNFVRTGQHVLQFCELLSNLAPESIPAVCQYGNKTMCCMDLKEDFEKKIHRTVTFNTVVTMAEQFHTVACRVRLDDTYELDLSKTLGFAGVPSSTRHSSRTNCINASSDILCRFASIHSSHLKGNASR